MDRPETRTRRRHRYPGTEEAERERSRSSRFAPIEEAPDFIAGAPNYDKWPDKTPEEVLVWLNID